MGGVMKNEQMPAWKAACIVLGTTFFLATFMYVQHHPEVVTGTMASLASGTIAD